jgi:hypothetical protein
MDADAVDQAQFFESGEVFDQCRDRHFGIARQPRLRGEAAEVRVVPVCTAQGFLIHFQLLDHAPGLVASRHGRGPARLARQSMGQGAEYRRKVELKWDGEFRTRGSMG